MREIIADKELSGAQPVQDDGADNEFIEAANDNEHLETKTRPSYKKGATLRLDGPVAGLVSLEKGAAYLGVSAPHRQSAAMGDQCKPASLKG
ncbi:hypothetical protein R6210_002993 [Escherichia coli]|nr:hypothetical protein [Escherichia coli]